MKQITKTYTVYSFDELSETAQQKAIEKLCDINVDYEWWQSVYDDAEMAGMKITGFDIDRGSYCDLEFINNEMDTAKYIVANHGDQCETYKTAKNFIENIDAIYQRANEAYKEEFGENFEKAGMLADNEIPEFDEWFEDNYMEEIEEENEEFKNSISEDYRIMLQKEYEYQTSEEAIKKMIEANEYTFLEDGTLKNF